MSLSKTISLTVNDYDIKLSSNIKFYQNDQLKLIFEINEYGIEVANGVKVKALMPVTPLSGTLFIETPLGVDSIESMIVENNTVTFYLSSTQTQYVGVSRMQIQLSDEDGCQVTLPPFEFEIRENIHDNEVVLQQVLLSDENNNIVVDENGNAINTGTQVSAQTYSVALPAEDETKTVTSQPTKQIKDYNLKNGVNGTEDLLIQDNGITKRIKTSELIDTVNVDVSICYTKEEVNALLESKANVSHTHVVSDITDLSIPTVDVNKTYVDTQLATKANKSEIPSLKGYATETFVTNKIAEASLSGGEVDLSGLATKDELATKADKVHTHDQYLTEHQDLSDYALKTEIPTVPTKVSQLTNDKGYLTSVPSEYITETELTGKSYATKKELTDSLTTKSDTTHNHDTIYSKLNHTHSQYLTSVPSEYVTETELNNKGYLTEHQDISMKADKTELHSHSNKTVLDGITSDKVTEWNNKSTFDGNYNSLINKPTIPTVPTKVSSFTNDSGYLSSSIIKSIVVVDALPEVEVEGVLYLVRGGTSTDTPTTPEEPTVTNLYPNQTTTTISDGFTITFTGRNVTINGRNDTASIQCQTNQFAMALEANKTYYLQFTNISGLFDDSKRVSQSDGMICMVALTVYDSSGKSKNLINWDERDASGIYEKFTFTPSFACVTGKLIIQAKKLTSFSNWTCSIVIAEEGV